MSRFWWIAAAVFLAALTVYTVGTGWASRWSIVNNVRHARRQLEPGEVVRDLNACGLALQTHGDRVLAFAFIFKEPDFRRAYAVGGRLGAFRTHFQNLQRTSSSEAAPSPQFLAAIAQLKSFRVPSISVMSPSAESALSTVTIIFGVLTALLGGLRLFTPE